MLVGLQLIYLLDVLSISSKSCCATLYHFKKFRFPFRKTSRWKFLDVKLAQLAVRMAAPMENNRTTTEELGKWVLYFIIHPPKSVDILNRKNAFFGICSETIAAMLLICGRFQFFHRKSANQNFESAICGFPHLRTDLRKCPALNHTNAELPFLGSYCKSFFRLGHHKK